MSEAPRLPPLPASFGNDSPFPPVATPRIPSAKYLSSASTPPLPPLRDEALQREQKLRQQENERQQLFYTPQKNGSGGLRPGQIIPSAQMMQGPAAYMGRAPSPMPMHSPMAMPMPAPIPRSPGPTYQGPPQFQSTFIAPPPLIQRPRTSDPRIPHSDSAPMALGASMESVHISAHPPRGASEQMPNQLRRGSHDDRYRNTARPEEYKQPNGTSSTTPSLNVVLPELEGLGVMREKALASGNDKKRLSWCKEVIKYVERKSEGTKISNPTLVQYIDECIGTINRLASSQSPLAESLYLRGDLLASGSFPTYHRKNLKSAFNDFELSARMGYAPSWFRIGRDYEILGDSNRARDAYERGCAVGDVGCIYRMGMANLLAQLDLPMNHERAIPLLREAADLANLDTPQPSYIYGMLLAGEFSHVQVSPRLLIPTPDPLKPHQPATIESEARRRIQRAAYLNFGPAQYRCGWSYEYAQLECSFDPLLSVQYYSLASQAGEIEADLALSKWFLCGAEGCFEKNEGLAFTFAEKAARKGLPSAEFAMGYYFEVGVGCEKSVEIAQKWYKKAASHGNADAKERLTALEGPSPATLSRSQHEVHVDTQLVRKRTEAKMMSDRKTAAKERKAAGLASNGPPSRSQPMPFEQPPMPSMDLRRKKTMKMVEETAKRGRGGATHGAIPAEWDRRGSAPNAASPATTASARPAPPRHAISLVDSGPTRMGAGPSPISNGRPPPSSPARGPRRDGVTGPKLPGSDSRASTNQSNGSSEGIAIKSNESQKQIYETFGEMGFKPAKAKDDKDCVIC